MQVIRGVIYNIIPIHVANFVVASLKMVVMCIRGNNFLVIWKVKVVLCDQIKCIPNFLVAQKIVLLVGIWI